ncbi:hypothetical protein ABBQ32_010122 [Trebouxia sp. C0010 RCD-2024]
MRRAMELSVLCDCDIAMFLFGPVDDRLAQYTSSDMAGLLDRYSRTCQQPHETRTNQDLIRILPSELVADVMGLHPQRKRRGRPALVHEEGGGDVSSVSDDSALQHRQMDILKPLGLAPEDVKLPLSPRSEDAYARINEEFDMLYSQLQDPAEQAGQNHERSPTSNDSMAGGPGAKGKRAGRVMPVKKRGAVKPRKKETAAAARKGTKGNLRAVVPTSNPTVLREVVAEGGMPTGSGQRQEAAAGSAAQMAAAAGPASLAAAAAAADRQLPTSAAPRQGGAEQRSGASAALQQPSAPGTSAAPQAEVTGPPASALARSATSAPPQSSTMQAAGAGHHHHHPPLGMPTGAVDMSRGAAGGESATLAQGVGVTPAGAGPDVAGVTFAPRHLTSYTTPNFFTGEAASALRDANKSRSASANAAAPGVVTAQPPCPSQTQGSQAAMHTHSEQESLPRQSPAALPSNNGEPPVKRRALRKQQPTQKAIEAGLAPALAGHQGQGHGSGLHSLHSLQDGAKQSQGPHGPVQSGVSLSAAQPEHMQTGMSVQ